MGTAIRLRITNELTAHEMTPGLSPAPNAWLAKVSRALDAPMMKNLPCEKLKHEVQEQRLQACITIKNDSMEV